MRKIPPRFFVPPLVPPEQNWHVVQHKKFPQNSKKKDVEIESYGEKEII